MKRGDGGIEQKSDAGEKKAKVVRLFFLARKGGRGHLLFLCSFCSSGRLETSMFDPLAVWEKPMDAEDGREREQRFAPHRFFFITVADDCFFCFLSLLRS